MLVDTFRGTLPADYVVENKIDGVRVMIHANRKTKEVKFLSRNGNRFTSLDHLKPQILAAVANIAGDVILDGEAVSGSFHETVGQIRHKTASATDAVIHLFDVVRPGTYFERRAVLETVMVQSAIKVVPYVRNADIESQFANALAAGFEGIVIKDVAADYECGERTGSWTKIKPVETHDLIVEGFYESTTGGLLGGFICRFKGQIIEVGAGMTNSVRRVLWSVKDSLIGRTVEVKCQEIMVTGMMRHASFVRIRDDK